MEGSSTGLDMASTTMTSSAPKANISAANDEQAKLQILMSSLTDEQVDRYEAFRRSKFSQSQIKKIVHSVTGVSPSANCCIVLCGIAKVLVGQVLEASFDVQDSLKESGPVQPKHIRDAVRRMRNRGELGFSGHRKHKLKRL